jgi:hypothetical protein
MHKSAMLESPTYELNGGAIASNLLINEKYSDEDNTYHNNIDQSAFKTEL